MNELTLTELDMGSATPRILKASEPSVDYRGKRQTVYQHTDVHTPAGFWLYVVRLCVETRARVLARIGELPLSHGRFLQISIITAYLKRIVLLMSS